MWVGRSVATVKLPQAVLAAVLDHADSFFQPLPGLFLTFLFGR